MTSGARHTRAGARRTAPAVAAAGGGTHAATARAAARRCTQCGERLSAYNPEPTCFAHTVGVPWKGPNQPR